MVVTIVFRFVLLEGKTVISITMTMLIATINACIGGNIVMAEEHGCHRSISKPLSVPRPRLQHIMKIHWFLCFTITFYDATILSAHLGFERRAERDCKKREATIREIRAWKIRKTVKQARWVRPLT